MLFLKTEGQANFCCAECAAGTTYLDLGDLSLAGLQVPFTNRNTKDFILKAGEHKMVGPTCSTFRFIGMAVAKPVKMGFRGKYEPNNYWMTLNIVPSSITANTENTELTMTFDITSLVSGFAVAPSVTQYVINPNVSMTGKEVKLQVLDTIADTYTFTIEIADGIILEFVMTVEDDLTFAFDKVNVKGLYSGTNYALAANGAEVNFSDLKKFVTLNNVFIADATFMGTVDSLELWNDSLQDVRVLILTATSTGDEYPIPAVIP